MGSPIRLVVGLGNPGREHERDRHNVGFWLLDRLASREKLELRKDAKYHALCARFAGPAGDVWLLAPQTYMNLSGKAVGALARFFKITPEETLVVHDELDFLPGTAKLKQGGGAGGHNGLKDIQAAFGSQDYWRVRVGIGHPGDRDLVADYVLGSPSPDDRTAIEASLDKVVECMPLMLAGDMTAAMVKLHSKDKPRNKGPATPPGAGGPGAPGTATASAQATTAQATAAQTTATAPNPATAPANPGKPQD